MKLNQFNGYKLFFIIICTILLIYHYNLLKTPLLPYQRSNGTDITATAEKNTQNEVTAVKRIKRFLIFQGGGVVKLVLGTSFPIKMADKKRSLNYFYNFQMQYAPPTIPLYWWSIYNTSTFAARKHSVEKALQFDNFRNFLYDFVQAALTRTENSANECLLNVICQLARAPFLEEEAAQQHFEESDKKYIEEDWGRNVYHKLLNAIFTPIHSNVKERYLNARKAGLNGADCDETFGKCSIAEEWLKKYTQFL